MKWIALITLTFGICYIIYVLAYRKKVMLYNRSKDIMAVYNDKYFKLQFYVAIFNSIFIIATSIAILKQSINVYFVLFIPFIFQSINLLFKQICKINGYIQK